MDAGRYPAKRTVGDLVEVSADVFRDGHEKLRAVAVHRADGGRRWHEAELHALDAQINGVRWGGSFVVDRPGRWEFSIEAWTDVFATWRDELRRKLEAGQHDLASELSEGVVLLQAVAERAKGADRKLIDHAAPRPAPTTTSSRPPSTTPRSGWSSTPPSSATPSATASPAWSRRSRSRSTASAPASAPGTSCSRAPGAGSRACRSGCPRLAELGFDVLYLTPIHPIGQTNRKGRNNALVAAPDDPGSPYAHRLGRRRPRRRAPGPRHRTTTSARCARRPPSTGSTSAWTSRSTRRPTTRG